MYDIFKDINRLAEYEDTGYVQASVFLWYTDNEYFVKGGAIQGYAETFNTREGRTYKKDTQLKPEWKDRWKNKERDEDLILLRDVKFNWISKGNHNFLKIVL